MMQAEHLFAELSPVRVIWLVVFVWLGLTLAAVVLLTFAVVRLVVQVFNWPARLLGRKAASHV